MKTRMHRTVVAGAVVTAAALTLAPLGARPSQAPDERTIYVSVMGGNGGPVGQLTAADFVVKEDGKAHDIVNVKYADTPIYYVVLVDTTAAAMNYVQYIRDSLTKFSGTVLGASPSSQIAFVEFGGAAMVSRDFTSKLGEIEAAIPKLMPKQSEPVFNEALVEAAKMLAKAPGPRRVILTVNFEPNEEASRMDGKSIAEQVRKSGATVWSVSVQTGTTLEANRDKLLQGLALNTGGLRATIRTPVPLQQYLLNIAALTIAQYEVTYKRLADEKPPKSTVVTVKSGVRAMNLVWWDK